MKYFQLLIILTLTIIMAGCGQRQTQVSSMPEPLEDLYVGSPPPQEAGSLWNANQASMFSDRKAQNIGDVVTVLIEESSSATKKASTATGRESSMSAGIPTLFGIEDNSIFANNGIDFSSLVSAEFENDFSGTGTTSRSGDLSASLTTQVIGKYPNGQLKIRGGKEVMVNNEVQVIYITGIIRPVDITAANTVNSDKILNARITYTGKGVIADKQQAGWLMRGLDNVWPF